MPPRIPSRRGRSIGRGPGPTREELLELRRRFLLDGSDPGDAVPAAILRSWRRSRAFGLDMDRRPSIESLTQQQLREMRERNELLLRAAHGEIEALYRDARDTGGIVILTDPHGVILATVGNVDFAERASRVSLRPGVQWTESSIGTNAIGTSIAEDRAIAVAGAEHFFEAHAILGCSAVPILDPSGERIGVLDLSNDAAVPQTHTLALVGRAVEQIERRLFEHRFGRHEQIHFHTDPYLVNSPHEGLLAFDEARLVGANRQALDLLGLDWTALGEMRFDQIFDARPEEIPREGPIEENRIRTRAGPILFGRMRRGFDGFAAVRRPPPAVSPPEPPPLLDRRFDGALERAARLADAGVAILVRGEVGSGKDAFARRLHAAGKRRDGPFVLIDCASRTPDELERDLFGDAAPTERPRLATGADGGMLMLETVEALPMPLQSRLARALDRSDADAAGERDRRDFTLLSTTRVALGDRVAAGTFAPGLLIRLAGHTVDLEPLRLHPDRRGLITEIWRTIAPAAHAGRLEPATLAALAAYHWPGNHRQLIATLRALAVLAEAGEALGPDVLPQEIRQPHGDGGGEASVGLDVEVDLDSITLGAMRAAVEAEGGNIARAARRLGIHRSTLYRRLGGDRGKD